MSMEEDLTRLVQATVRTEVENHMRTRSSEIIGRGGDVVLGGMGNIYLQPGVNKKAYYKGVEIGTGGGGGGTITGSGTTNYIPRFTGAAAIGNSHLVDDGSTITSSLDVKMAATTTLYHAYGGVKTGEMESAMASEEGVDYYGIRITSYNTHGTNPGSLYIGDDTAKPGGVGILVTNSAISIIPVSGGNINIYGTLASQETEGSSLYRMKINNSSSPPSIGKGGIYYDTDDNNAYVNKGTYAAPDWQLMGGAAVWGAITGTLSNQTDLQTALDAKLNLTGGTLTNDLTIKDANPMLYFINDSDSPLGSIGSLGGGLYIGNDVDAGSIYIRTGATPAIRVQIYDTGVALGVPLSMGTQKIYFSDGYGIDFRNDGVHKIAYAAGTNSLDIQSYQTINLKTTYDSGTPLSAAHDGIRIQEALFVRKNHAADNCYIVDDASGAMELHVPTGQKFKFVIG